MEYCIDISEERTINCNIHRVSEGLRKAKREAYEPMVVSIGPYHLENPNIKAMKKHKLRYLHLLLKRSNKNKDTYVVELKKLEDKVRKCYAQPFDDLKSEDFVEMMLLDACFIIEFFRKESPDPFIDVACMENQIRRDLMLFENQLPFFLLSHFYDMIKNPNDDGLQFILLSFLSKIIPPPCLKIPNHDLGEIKHLLHLVHVFCCPLPKQTASSEILNPMHSAVELEEAGVKFKVIGEYHSSKAHLFDIKFKDGLMKVPSFSVEDSTDTFFRNLIAFEQHSKDIVPKYFTDYMDFMDQLISSEKDVKLLRDEGIIVNYLGEDKEVSDLFNKLGDGVTVSDPTFYHDVVSDVNLHYNKPWNKLRAKLLHDYFNNPWAGISTIGAIAILVLTLLQTIKSFEN